jgi:hypothetical protein
MMDSYFWSYWVISIGYYTHCVGYPSEGICMLDLFGGISTGLAIVLQVGIPVWKYLYVERDETTRRVSSCHFALLMRRYPELLPRSAIRGY